MSLGTLKKIDLREAWKHEANDFTKWLAQEANLSLLADELGVAQVSLEETMGYVRERRAFGKPLATFEGISFRIAEMATHIDACRGLCYRAMWLADQGLPHSKESAMTKWWGPKLAVETIHQCLLFHGHYGYTDELPFEQRMRDVIGLEIGDGTAEVMKTIVARELMGRESRPY